MSNDLERNDVGHNRGLGLRKLAEFVLARRRWVLAFWVIMLIVGGMCAGKVQDRLSTDFSMPGQPGYEAAKKIETTYGNGGENTNSLVVISAPSGQSIATQQAQIDAAVSQVRAAHPEARILDYTSTGDRSFITSDGGTEFLQLMTPLPKGFSAEPPSKAITEEIAAAIPGAGLNETGKPAAPTNATTVAVTGAGELALGNEEPGTGVFAETLIAGVGALAVLLYVFASFLAIIPLMIAAVSICTTLAIVLLLTTFAEVSFIVLFLVSLVGLGVAIDYSLLIVTRWREELDKGADNAEAIKTSMETAGHAVLLSGLTVAIGLVALVVVPVPSLRSVGYGGMLIPVISVLVTLTMLPAMLSGFGRRLNWPRVRHDAKPSRAWTAWARLIVKQRWAASIIAIAVLVIMIIPVHNLRIGQTSSSALATSGPAFDAFKKLTDGGVPTGVLTPLEVMVNSDQAGNVADRLRGVEGISSVVQSSAADSNKANTTVLLATPTIETSNSSNIQPVKDARNAVDGLPGVVGLSGSGPGQLDYLDGVFGKAPLVFAIIAVLAFLLLVRAFHSVLLAFKALVLNVISLAAIFGLMTFFWQDGHGSQAIFDVSATGAITFWIPTMVFAFLFGLSMDYEVFILARMREQYDRTGSTPEAVIEGIGRTGRLVTSAALILFMSFASLALSGFTDLKVLATALGAGILLDATIVRAFLLPSLVALFGEANWWMPKWLATVLRTEVPEKPNVSAHRNAPSGNPQLSTD